MKGREALEHAIIGAAHIATTTTSEYDRNKAVAFPTLLASDKDANAYLFSEMLAHGFKVPGEYFEKWAPYVFEDWKVDTEED